MRYFIIFLDPHEVHLTSYLWCTSRDLDSLSTTAVARAGSFTCQLEHSLPRRLAFLTSQDIVGPESLQTALHASMA